MAKGSSSKGSSKPSSKPQEQIVRRSAKDGRFVTEEYAKRHPNTTVTERNK
jgi:hypothetical protein